MQEELVPLNQFWKEIYGKFEAAQNRSYEEKLADCQARLQAATTAEERRKAEEAVVDVEMGEYRNRENACLLAEYLGKHGKTFDDFANLAKDRQTAVFQDFQEEYCDQIANVGVRVNNRDTLRRRGIEQKYEGRRSSDELILWRAILWAHVVAFIVGLLTGLAAGTVDWPNFSGIAVGIAIVVVFCSYRIKRLTVYEDFSECGMNQDFYSLRSQYQELASQAVTAEERRLWKLKAEAMDQRLNALAY